MLQRSIVTLAAVTTLLAATTAFADEPASKSPPGAAQTAEPPAPTVPAATDGATTSASPPPTAAPTAAPAPPDAATPPGASATPPPPPEVTALDLLTFHRDNYLLTGFVASTQVKFQFSAKYDLWPNEGHHAVFFGYTQKALWDLYRSSAPFRENNYSPEIFYTYFHHRKRYEPRLGCHFFHERAGFEHESNGESGNQSRSWNRAFIESRFACYEENRTYGLATLRLWAPPFGREGNEDITRYLGYGELALSVGTEGSTSWYGEADVTVRGRKGTSRKLGLGSIQVDARWRPRVFSVSRFTPYLYAQVFTGFGETLLTYDSALSNVRVGIGFSDRSTRSD